MVAGYSRLSTASTIASQVECAVRFNGSTRALDSGLSYRQVQMMSKRRDPKTVVRYDHGRENLVQNAVNFLEYDEA